MLKKKYRSKFTNEFKNGMINNKIRYGLELWWGTTEENFTKIHKIQHRAARQTLGPKYDRKSDN